MRWGLYWNKRTLLRSSPGPKVGKGKGRGNKGKVVSRPSQASAGLSESAFAFFLDRGGSVDFERSLGEHASHLFWRVTVQMLWAIKFDCSLEIYSLLLSAKKRKILIVDRAWLHKLHTHSAVHLMTLFCRKKEQAWSSRPLESCSVLVWQL